jgi:effector-binding domain-containing protein
MKKFIQIISLLLIIYSCSSETKKEHSKKELSKKEIKALNYKLADLELSNQKEKIILLSTIKKVPYDTLYLILKDYYATISVFTYHSDSCVFIYNKTINSISKNYHLPKSKVASIIFSFKYEMQTKQDILDDVDQEDQAQQDDYQDTSGY